jgi:hypothetical protein
VHGAESVYADGVGSAYFRACSAHNHLNAIVYPTHQRKLLGLDMFGAVRLDFLPQIHFYEFSLIVNCIYFFQIMHIFSILFNYK